ncbi:MAG: hypothetical protein K2L52_05860 [Clostridia bacterium]|nr:hypothetical protein [Clostridia bacterium]
MKKRHFLAAITVMVLAIVMVVSFVACDGNNDKDPANMKGEQVTAEQWAKAFDFSDATNVTYKDVMSGSEDGMAFTVTTIREYDGDKMHSKRTMEYTDESGDAQTEVDEYYRAKEGGKIYQYEYDEDTKTWSREEITFDVEWGIGNFDTFINDFDKFTYDNDKNGYVATYDESPLLIKIIGGKFAYAETEMKEGQETVKDTITIFGIGTTSVTLPPVA